MIFYGKIEIIIAEFSNNSRSDLQHCAALSGSEEQRNSPRDVFCMFRGFFILKGEHVMKQSNKNDIAMKVSNVSIAANLLLSVLKAAAGIIAHSSAMISDAIHSASDVFSTFIVIIGFRLSAKEADKEHPYGHERLECAASIILAVILLIIGLEIGRSAVQTLISGSIEEIKIPGRLALIAAIVSIAVKEAMYQYTIYYAKQIHSPALKADAWHHRSDSLSSVGALIGIGGARLGVRVLEPIACVVICLFIVKAAGEIFKDAIDKMIDKSCDDETEQKMKKVIENEPGVRDLVLLNTRMFGSKIYVDTIIAVDGDIPLTDAHDIAEHVHSDIETNFPDVKHCMVHVDPT